MKEAKRKARKLWLFCKSFWKNCILKRKFKSYYLFFTDKEFKKDIEYLYQLTKFKREFVISQVTFGKLIPSHRIVYPEYVKQLDDGRLLELLKVTKDGPGYRIIDGNHRFEAMKTWIDPNDLIYVRELV